MFQFNPEAIATLFARAEQEVTEGPLPACQLALAYDGRIVAEATYGAPADARFVTFSVTKALNAAAAWLLMGDGLVAPATRVCEVVPEFTDQGKEAVTVEHLLTHTAGFPRAPMRPEEGADPAARRARFATWRTDWEPGTRTEYHATSAWWVLADIIERTTGLDHREFTRHRITRPLALDSLRLGVPEPEQGDIVRIELVGDGGSGDVDFGGMDSRELAAASLLRFNEPSVRAAGVPGAGAVGRAGDVALLYQAFLHNPDQLWDPAVLADATGHVRNTLVDPLTQVPANRTLGLVVAGDDGKAANRQLGSGVGPRAFGAAGVGGQMAWADPDSGVSFCFLTSGLDVDLVASWARSHKLATRAGHLRP